MMSVNIAPRCISFSSKCWSPQINQGEEVSLGAEEANGSKSEAEDSLDLRRLLLEVFHG